MDMNTNTNTRNSSMTRSRIKREQIANAERRNAAFRKRMESLQKKADELSTLCGITAAVVVHNNWEDNAVLWPTPALLTQRMNRFIKFGNEDREKRTMTHEKLLEQKVQGERDEIAKLKKTIQMKEAQQLMVKSLKTSFEGLRLDQLKAMVSFADEMLMKLAAKDMELNDLN